MKHISFLGGWFLGVTVWVNCCEAWLMGGYYAVHVGALTCSPCLVFDEEKDRVSMGWNLLLTSVWFSGLMSQFGVIIGAAFCWFVVWYVCAVCAFVCFVSHVLIHGLDSVMVKLIEQTQNGIWCVYWCVV